MAKNLLYQFLLKQAPTLKLQHTTGIEFLEDINQHKFCLLKLATPSVTTFADSDTYITLKEHHLSYL